MALPLERRNQCLCRFAACYAERTVHYAKASPWRSTGLAPTMAAAAATVAPPLPTPLTHSRGTIRATWQMHVWRLQHRVHIVTPKIYQAHTAGSSGTACVIPSADQCAPCACFRVRQCGAKVQQHTPVGRHRISRLSKLSLRCDLAWLDCG